MLHSPQNLIAQSQSGTGKTAAFVLAMLSRVEPGNKYPQVKGAGSGLGQEGVRGGAVPCSEESGLLLRPLLGKVSWLDEHTSVRLLL